MKLWILAGVVLGVMTIPVLAADNSEARAPASCMMSETMTAAVQGFLVASSSISYHGTLLVEYGGDREFIAIDVDPDSDQNGLKRLNQSAEPMPRLVTARHHATRGPCELARYYSLAIEPGSAVAGRATYRLSARPKDTLRLAYVMNIDAEYHVPLRVLAASPEGQILERYEFADITLEPKSTSSNAVSSESAAGTSRYFLSSVPPGFTVIDEGRNPVDFIVLSDGLASVSIFVETQPRALPSGEGFALRGASLAYTRGIAQKKLVTVLGEVPITTARLLAEALRQRSVAP
ncbi:MAG: MucB/RseB C-terminal domain-containing protein [Luminiphilus sp.]|jgi:sigma-E factor negative regulatory protein RseB|nr:MucB/RseB C-terminal domain-containing protein [Luminiphilus sp.]MDG1460819.1 MucB/RseB C-terminal domain-containing protein [Luminiphilus sp.]